MQDPQAAVDRGIDELAGSRLRRRRQEAREGCCAQALHERIELGPNPLRGGLPGGFGELLSFLVSSQFPSYLDRVEDARNLEPG